jgi:hypothetical protein
MPRLKPRRRSCAQHLTAQQPPCPTPPAASQGRVPPAPSTRLVAAAAASQGARLGRLRQLGLVGAGWAAA